MKITVDHILNIETGEYISSEKLLGIDKIKQFQLRYQIESEIQKQLTQYVCAICLQKIKLRAGEKNRFHFAHLKDSEYCPIKTDTKYNKKEWLSIIYHGAKESKKHIHLKQMIYDALINDNRFKDILIEKTIKEIDEKIKWKRPDIQCLYNDQKYIFEIQLSHTFISVIVARELFYKKNEMPLFWIFDEFKPESDYVKAFQGDIFAHNNCNVFVFDNDTYDYSIKNKKLFLKVYWLEPHIIKKSIESKWNYATIDFSEIYYDEKNYRAYYYDYDKNLKKQKYILRKEMIFDLIRKDDDYSKNIELFHHEINEMNEFNLEIWNDKQDIYKIYNLFRALLSIRERKNYGYKNQNVIWMLNIFYNSNKELYWIILNYIKNTNFDQILCKEKKYKTFLIHNKEYAQSNIDKNDKYTNYTHWFFPEIKGAP